MKGRLCFGCAVGGWETMASRGGRAKQSAERKRKLAVSDVYGYETVLEVLAPALTAVVDEPGFPPVPDWGARLAACALLIECFPEYMRETLEQTRELLEKLLPDRVGRERLSPEAAYRALAEERHRLRERGHPLTQFEPRKIGWSTSAA